MNKRKVKSVKAWAYIVDGQIRTSTVCCNYQSALDLNWVKNPAWTSIARVLITVIPRKRKKK